MESPLSGESEREALKRRVEELEQAALELERVRARYEAIFNASLDGILLTNDEGRYVAVNPAASAMLGYTQEELLRGQPTDNVVPEMRAQLWERFQEFKRAGKPVRVEYSLVRKDGSLAHVETVAVPNIEPGLHLTVRRDATERKRAEETLRASEARLRALVENSYDAIALVDNQGVFRYLTPSVRAITGYGPEELLGTVGFDLIHPDDVGLTMAHFVRMVQSADYRPQVQYRTRHRDGGWRWTEARGTNLLDDPSVGAIVVNFRDISEKKAAEELMAVRMRQRSILANLGRVGVRETDLDRFMQEVAFQTAQALDAEYCKVLQLLPGGNSLLLRAATGWKEELIGKATVGAGRESQAGYTLQSHGPVVVEDVGAETRFSESALFQDYHVTSGMSVVIDGKAGPYGVLGVGTSQRRTFTEDDVNFLQSVAHLLNAAVERESGERLRSEFLGMVTHELRSPLAAIKSAIALIESEAEGQQGEMPQFLDAMEAQADRMLGLVGNLLDMAQIEAGAFSVNPRPTDPRTVLQEAVTNFSTLNAVPVELDAPEGLPLLPMDQQRISQVLGNLLSNAARHRKPGTAVRVRAEQADEAVVVSVQNEGRPIPANQMPLLFEKFTRLDNDRETGMGTGLGLAISKGIIEAHSGRVWAESDQEREEVTFFFSLPTTVLTREADRQPAGTTEAPSQADQGKPERVVLVDDEPLLLRHLERVLSRAGYDAKGTVDPEEGIRLVRELRPSLLLLDVMMPKLNGFEVLAEVRQWSDVPVIFVSASNREEDKVRGLGLGADDYVTKPFSPAELLARVERAISRHAGRPG